jgi:hypothetical protein
MNRQLIHIHFLFTLGTMLLQSRVFYLFIGLTNYTRQSINRPYLNKMIVCPSSSFCESSAGSLFDSLASKYWRFESLARKPLTDLREHRAYYMIIRGVAERPEDVRRFRCRMNKTASTVRQITLMPPRTPPTIGPRGVDLLVGGLRDVSLVAGASDYKDGVSVVKVFEEPFVDVLLESELVVEIVVEASFWVVANDGVVVAGTE